MPVEEENAGMLTFCFFYQPRSGMVMQNCRSKKKKSVTFAFFDVVASVLADFRCVQLVLANYGDFDKSPSRNQNTMSAEALEI